MHIITGEEKADSQEEETKEEIIPIINGIYILADIGELERNSNHKFTAHFEGEGDYSKTVIWQIIGQKDENTWIDDTGLLSVGANEESSDIKVIATSADNKELKSELNVKVANPYIKEVKKPTTKEELKEQAQASELTEEEKAKKISEQEAIKAQAIADTSGGEKDKYLTDPTPEGKPKPVEPEEITINESITKTATLSISCETILNNLDMFDKDKIDVLPVDGIILSSRQVTFFEGESVFDVLKRTVQDQGIHMEFVFTPIYNSVYVEGINNLYEFDCGPLSGWMYKVNGWFPNYGASRYKLEDGDVINWVYTCDLGADVGDNSMTGGQ
ncbi:MAG: DUF4430 domain-containing protein [Tissierellia bacterium]|nr:DUF4430 domain-containing protein [Tissierellia bacterium]